MADARRQLLLKSFASTGGDVERTATMLGISQSEVRAELGTIMQGEPGTQRVNGRDGAPPAMAAKAPARTPPGKPAPRPKDAKGRKGK
jgi:hypothetical protein